MLSSNLFKKMLITFYIFNCFNGLEIGMKFYVFWYPYSIFKGKIYYITLFAHFEVKRERIGYKNEKRIL